MRSRKLCLLICLTSCLLELPTCLAISELFCSKGAEQETIKKKTHGNDCMHKEISEADFEWKLETTFGERKEVPKYKYVEIDMHRALYIEADTVEIQSVKFNPANENQCKNVLIVKIDSRGAKTFLIETANNVYLNVEKNQKVVVAVFEPECRLYAKHDDAPLPGKNLKKAKHLDHLFLRNLKPMVLPEIILDRTLTDNENRGLGNFIVSPGVGLEEGLHNDILTHNLFFPYETKNLDRKECNNKCLLGKEFMFELQPGLSFGNTFKLKSSCEWMTIHLNLSNDTTMNQATEISLRHGFVTLPTEVKAYPMDFKTIDNKYEVIMTYYGTDDSNDRQISNILVGNRHGRAVYSQGFARSTENIKFVFSHDECLDEFIGSDVEDKKMKDFDFNEMRNLGYRVSYLDDNRKSWRGWRYVAPERSGQDMRVVYVPKNMLTYQYAALPGEHVDAVKEFNEKTTMHAYVPMTDATLNPNITAAPGVTAATYVVDEETNKKVKEIIDANARAMNALKNAMKAGGYYYWAIPAGFATGSFASFIIANIILFVFKRTVLNFWYKAMYKRYGSDTTMGAGTTMGKTEAGETIGGSTTVGGGTTMGGTTAGETASTTAA